MAIVGDPTEEGFVLADKLAFIVEHNPVAAYPSRIHMVSNPFNRPGFCLDLFLNFSAESIGVGKAVLYLCHVVGSKIRVVGFPL